jgi:hypothetical protein
MRSISEERVFKEVGVAAVVEGVGELADEVEALVKLADGQEPGNAGQGRVLDLDHDRGIVQKMDQQRWRKVYTHGRPLWELKNLSV